MHTAYIQPPGAPPVKVCYIVTYKSCHILGALLQTYRIFDFGNTIIIRHLGPENRQNPTQKDTNFRNTMILHYLGHRITKIKPRKTQILRKCTQ